MSIPIVAEILTVVLDFINKIWDTIPRSIKALFFLAIIIFTGSLISNITVGTFYACTTTGSLMNFDGVGEAVDYKLSLTFFGEGIKDDYISGNTTAIQHDNSLLFLSQPVFVEDDYGLFKVDCVKDYSEDVTFYYPALLVIGINIFDPLIWLLILIIVIIVTFGWKWNDQIMK